MSSSCHQPMTEEEEALEIQFEKERELLKKVANKSFDTLIEKDRLDTYIKSKKSLKPWFKRLRYLPIFSKHNKILYQTIQILVILIAVAILIAIALMLTAIFPGVVTFHQPVAIIITALIAAIGVLLGFIVADWNRADNRVGIAQTLASDILSIGRILVSSNMIGTLSLIIQASNTKPEDPKYDLFLGDALEIRPERVEDYFVVFHAHLDRLPSFGSDVVTEITAFYTVLKGSRDKMEQLNSWKKIKRMENKRDGKLDKVEKSLLISTLYLLLLNAEHGRRSIDALLELDALFEEKEDKPPKKREKTLAEYGHGLFRLMELQALDALEKICKSEDKILLNSYRSLLVEERVKKLGKLLNWARDNPTLKQLFPGGPPELVDLIVPTEPFDATEAGGAQLAAFDTAMGKLENAMAVLAQKLNLVRAVAGLDPIIYEGTVAAAGTIPALDKTITAASGAGAVSLASGSDRMALARLGLQRLVFAWNETMTAAGMPVLANLEGSFPPTPLVIPTIPAAEASADGADAIAKAAADAFFTAAADNVAILAARFNAITWLGQLHGYLRLKFSTR